MRAREVEVGRRGVKKRRLRVWMSRWEEGG